MAGEQRLPPLPCAPMLGASFSSGPPALLGLLAAGCAVNNGVPVPSACWLCRQPWEPEDSAEPWEARGANGVVLTWAHPSCVRKVKRQVKRPGWSPKPEPEQIR